MAFCAMADDTSATPASGSFEGAPREETVGIPKEADFSDLISFLSVTDRRASDRDPEEAPLNASLLDDLSASSGEPRAKGTAEGSPEPFGAESYAAPSPDVNPFTHTAELLAGLPPTALLSPHFAANTPAVAAGVIPSGVTPSKYVDGPPALPPPWLTHLPQGQAATWSGLGDDQAAASRRWAAYIEAAQCERYPPWEEHPPCLGQRDYHAKRWGHWDQDDADYWARGPAPYIPWGYGYPPRPPHLMEDYYGASFDHFYGFEGRGFAHQFEEYRGGPFDPFYGIGFEGRDFAHRFEVNGEFRPLRSRPRGCRGRRTDDELRPGVPARLPLAAGDDLPTDGPADRVGLNAIHFEAPARAKFFVVKSFTAADVRQALGRGVWASTEHGNQRLQAAYDTGAPVFLFFSVNGSGFFCGMARMVSGVDPSQKADCWGDDRWGGSFRVRWLYLKDVPNRRVHHLRVGSKSVTRSRDAQEMPHEQGRQMAQVFVEHRGRSSLLDPDTDWPEDPVETEWLVPDLQAD
jgi:hypothetical protein